MSQSQSAESDTDTTHNSKTVNPSCATGATKTLNKQNCSLIFVSKKVTNFGELSSTVEVEGATAAAAVGREITFQPDFIRNATVKGATAGI